MGVAAGVGATDRGAGGTTRTVGAGAAGGEVCVLSAGAGAGVGDRTWVCVGTDGVGAAVAGPGSRRGATGAVIPGAPVLVVGVVLKVPMMPVPMINNATTAAPTNHRRRRGGAVGTRDCRDGAARLPGYDDAGRYTVGPPATGR